MLYQQRQNIFLKEQEGIENTYRSEVLKAQLEMQEQTFRTISQEIHDNIGQALSLIRLNISMINPDDYVSTQRRVSSSKELLDQAIEDLRDLSKGMNAEFIRNEYLSRSLQFQLNLVQKTGRYHTKLQVHGEERLLPPEKNLIVFRIFQEAINNIIRHAEATRITVVLAFSPNRAILTIQDDGVGFAPPVGNGADTPRKGIGTYNMYYRASLIGGQFAIQSSLGKGTTAQLILPTTS